MNNIIGNRIKEVRKENHLTQKELSNLVHLSSQVISNFERGYSRPGADDLDEISNALNVSTDYLLGKTYSKKAEAPKSASNEDFADLKRFMDYNEGSMTYDGENLTLEEEEQVRTVMETVFWRRQQTRKKLDNGNKE